ATSLGLISSDSRQFRIGEHAEWDQAILRGSIAAVQVVVNDAEVVISDVRELRAARAIAHSPNVIAGRLQPFVDLDEPVLVELDAGQLEPDSIGVRRSARRNQQVGAFDGAFAATAIHLDPDAIAGASLDLASLGSK